ncbi:aminoglycoside phosphotransferase family protein [Tabrizicola sp. BL-A-41-H6]|uniref:aminoglycoside phosphotransferase family protein n=1 Tax=Tabrizicola sp. BL-A-41-H6 TaxID=3421107 RepID=UPI003D664741
MREATATAFLAAAGWGNAARVPLAGDASARSYQRLTLAGRTAILMDNAPGGADDPASFVAIARHLRSLSLSAPEVLAADVEAGFLLLEDLGDAVFARLLEATPEVELALYTAATDVLLHLQARAAPPGLPNLGAAEWAEAAMLVLDWYATAVTGNRPPPAALRDTLGRALSELADGPRVLVLRDYHAENLIWLPERAGLARVGLLDFQLAQMGQPAYDLVSLLQDARRDVGLGTEAALIQHFAAATGQDKDSFSAAYAAVGAQRALRILGIFARLCLDGGKAGYVRLIPRVWDQLQRNLAHPALAALRAVCDKLLPPPTPEALLRIEAQCNRPPTRF